MRRIEAGDPDRHLVGFEYRLKEPDRLKEKVTDDIELHPVSEEEAMRIVDRMRREAAASG